METKISARHGSLSEATQEKIAAKVEKLTRFFDRVTTIEVTVNLEHRDAPSVDLKVSATHKHEFVATAQSDELMAAMDAALHKVEHQIHKYKDKIQKHHRAPTHRQTEVEE